MSCDRAPRWASSFRQRPRAKTVALFGRPAALFYRAQSKLVEWDRHDAKRESQPVGSWLRPDCMFIDILFLGVVYPHKRLDRFDDALSVPDEIAIDFSGRGAVGEPS